MMTLKHRETQDLPGIAQQLDDASVSSLTTLSPMVLKAFLVLPLISYVILNKLFNFLILNFFNFEMEIMVVYPHRINTCKAFLKSAQH